MQIQLADLRHKAKLTKNNKQKMVPRQKEQQLMQIYLHTKGKNNNNRKSQITLMPSGIALLLFMGKT